MTDEYGNNPIGSTTNFKLTHDEQKHEEIKLMAFELHIKNSMFKEDAWKMAEKFYDYAKEKEREEANDEM